MVQDRAICRNIN